MFNHWPTSFDDNYLHADDDSDDDDDDSNEIDGDDDENEIDGDDDNNDDWCWKYADDPSDPSA